MKILIVEDEGKLADAIEALLHKAGYLCETVQDGQEALDYIVAVPYDLIILDVMLPSLDGFEIVSQMRRKEIHTPVLMLTALSSVADKVAGLNAGADDYIAKPFSTDELLARVKAMCRRVGTTITHTLCYDDLILDIDAGVLSCGMNNVQLSRRELEVMRLLLRSPQSVVSKQTLLMHVWGMNSEATDNNVEAYVSFLRKKLRHIGSRVSIATKIMIGYRLEIESL